MSAEFLFLCFGQKESIIKKIPRVTTPHGVFYCMFCLIFMQNWPLIPNAAKRAARRGRRYDNYNSKTVIFTVYLLKKSFTLSSAFCTKDFLCARPWTFLLLLSNSVLVWHRNNHQRLQLARQFHHYYPQK